MPRIDENARLAELRTAAEIGAEAYNNAMLEEKFSDAAKLATDIDELVKEYNSIMQNITFKACKDSDDPMLAAVTKLEYGVIAAKDQKSEDSKVPVKIIVDKVKQIDLAKLHKFCGGIGNDQNWIYMVENFNFVMTARIAKELGVSPERLKEISDSYAMSKIARDMGSSVDGADPTSNTQIQEKVSQCVEAMIGGEFAKKIVSRDAKYLIRVYSGKSRKTSLTVKCSNHNYMRGYMMDICHHLVTGKPYDVEFKAAK